MSLLAVAILIGLAVCVKTWAKILLVAAGALLIRAVLMSDVPRP